MADNAILDLLFQLLETFTLRLSPVVNKLGWGSILHVETCQ